MLSWGFQQPERVGWVGFMGHQEYLIRQIPGMWVDFISIKYILFGKEVDGKNVKISYLGRILMAIFPFWEIFCD